MIAWLKKTFKSKKTKETWGGKLVLWDTPFVKVTHIWVEPGQATEVLATQEFAVKQWLFFKGSGDYTSGPMKKKILPGTNATFTSGIKHAIAASNEKVEVLEIQSGEKFAAVAPVLQLPASNPKP
jgi:mannose-6-phosphate isomerase-like protein (cupin superfamily)